MQCSVSKLDYKSIENLFKYNKIVLMNKIRGTYALSLNMPLMKFEIVYIWSIEGR